VSHIVTESISEYNNIILRVLIDIRELHRLMDSHFFAKQLKQKSYQFMQIL